MGKSKASNGRKRFYFLAFLLMLIFATVMSGFPNIQTHTFLPDEYLKNLFHFAVFFFLGLFFLKSFTVYTQRKPFFSIIYAVLGIVFAAANELQQILEPSRIVSFTDFLFNLSGLLLAYSLVLYLAISKMSFKRKSKKKVLVISSKKTAEAIYDYLYHDHNSEYSFQKILIWDDVSIKKDSIKNKFFSSFEDIYQTVYFEKWDQIIVIEDKKDKEKDSIIRELAKKIKTDVLFIETTHKPRIAIVHDFLNQQGGAEFVVSVLHELFPAAPIYTSLYKKGASWSVFDKAIIHTSWMQKLPFVYKLFKKLFFLYPLAFAFFDLKKYDVIISSSSAYAKGIPVKHYQEHICYMHTPARFLYRAEEYVQRERINPVLRFFLPYFLTALRIWDRYTVRHITHLIANSDNVKNRIENIYNRYSLVIYPPVDTSRFPQSDVAGDYFFIVSRLVGYKRIDLAVKACTKSGKRLVIIGEGPDMEHLKSFAGDNIIFMGRQPNFIVEKMMAGCLAFIFPGEEDFGISPVEAQAAGKPVIAFRSGGALETIIENKTGLFFDEQTPEALEEMLFKFDTIAFDKEFISNHAIKFSKERFKKDIQKIINNIMNVINDPNYQRHKYYFNDQRINPKEASFSEILKEYRKKMKLT
ncbi:MAG: VanZ family protein [Candidatus Margulisbacteria bacterium]|nr:VanZ family protein [Candidatus Margulisiibacteriota bacterium]